MPAQAPAPREPEVSAQAAVQAGAQAADAWAEVCEQFAWRLLVLTEGLRPALDGLENSEEDPDRLAQLYQVDHGVTRMRQVARDLRVLTDRGGEEIAGHTTALLDVIRMAASAIEQYSRISVGPVAELAVVPYAADDVAALLAALTDNATRYSPSAVTVSAHLLVDGSVMFRVEDSGLGIEPGWLAALNTALDGPVPAIGMINVRHSGFAVIHRLARRHGLRVQLARRQPPGHGAPGVSGTIAMVVVPAPLLCEIPSQPAVTDGHSAESAGPPVVPLRAARSPAHAAASEVAVPAQDRPGGGTGGALPRREPRSVRRSARPQGAAPPGQDRAPDPAADGFAFADDLQMFSAALGTGGSAGAGAGEDRPGDAEGQTP
jgi:hypothetical protein